MHPGRGAGAAALWETPSLGAVLAELDRTGTGSVAFWQRVWAALPHLSDAELVRLARTVGPAARASLRRLSVAQARRV